MVSLPFCPPKVLLSLLCGSSRLESHKKDSRGEVQRVKRQQRSKLECGLHVRPFLSVLRACVGWTRALLLSGKLTVYPSTGLIVLLVRFFLSLVRLLLA